MASTHPTPFPGNRPGRRVRGPALPAMLLAAVVLWSPTWAWAQQNDQLRALERIESLEESIKDIRRVLEEDLRELRQSAGGGGLSSGDVERLLSRLADLSDQVAALNGRLERTIEVAGDNEFRMLRLERRVDNLIRAGVEQAPGAGQQAAGGPVGTGTGDIPSSNLSAQVDQEAQWTIGNRTLQRELSNNRSDSGDSRDAGSNTRNTVRLAATGAAAGSVLPDSDPEEQYKFALGKALQNDLEVAEQAFGEFTSRHAGHALMADASFWLGRVQFMRGSYEKAVKTFSDFNTQWPDDARIEKTTLWIGESVPHFATREEVCELLELLPSQVSDPTDGFHDRIDSLKAESNCT